MRRRPARNLTVVMVDKKVGGYEHDLAYAPVASALTHLVDLPNCVGVFASIPYALAAVGLGPTERVAAGPEPVQAALVAVRDRAAAVARAADPHGVGGQGGSGRDAGRRAAQGV